jgi:hypothetical protein
MLFICMCLYASMLLLIRHRPSNPSILCICARPPKALVAWPAEFEAAEDPVAAWADSLLQQLRDAARTRREAFESAAAAKEAKRQAERVQLREQAMAVLRRQLKHVSLSGLGKAGLAGKAAASFSGLMRGLL